MRCSCSPRPGRARSPAPTGCASSPAGILWGHARRIVGALESDTRLRPAADDLIERIGKVEFQPKPLADALTAWVATEARAYRPPDPKRVA